MTTIAAAGLLCSPLSYGDDESGQLHVEFDTPIATITSRPNNRPLQLPDLTYKLRAEAHCVDPQSAQTISVSIADTRITFQPLEPGIIEKEIRISQKQLGPVAVAGFCLAEKPEGEPLLEISDALSAQVSLRCSGENHTSISYTTVTLGVALQCDLPDDTDPTQTVVESPATPQ